MRPLIGNDFLLTDDTGLLEFLTMVYRRGERGRLSGRPQGLQQLFWSTFALPQAGANRDFNAKYSTTYHCLAERLVTPTLL